MRKKIISILLMYVVFLLLVTPSVKARAVVYLSNKSVQLDIGETIKVELVNATKKVIWSTLDKKVATVKNGKIRAVGRGKTTITAKHKGRKYNCEVEVNSIGKCKIEFDLNEYSDYVADYITENMEVISCDETKTHISFVLKQDSYDDVIAKIKNDIDERNLDYDYARAFRISDDYMKYDIASDIYSLPTSEYRRGIFKYYYYEMIVLAYLTGHTEKDIEFRYYKLTGLLSDESNEYIETLYITQPIEELLPNNE